MTLIKDAAANTEDAIDSPPMSFNVKPRGERDVLYLAIVAALMSVAAFVYFFLHNEILLYGDATAHIHIARRVFDSRTPGPMQLGTVWLPLPHLLMIPFILSNWMWRSGLGGSIPSMVAYVFGVLGIFRLVHDAVPRLLTPTANQPIDETVAAGHDLSNATTAARVAGWCAALAFALNPNLLYLQSTAMTESLSIALFVWATVYFSEFVHATRATGELAQEHRAKTLTRCGWLLMALMLTRYDGWFAAAVFAVAAAVVFWNWTGRRIDLWRSPLRPIFVKFVILLAIAPVLWFAYNTWNWGNPLEFATGPYSARAIEARAERPGGWHYPGWHSPATAATYFVKSAKLNMAGGPSQRETEHAKRWRLENLWFPLAIAGTLLLLLLARGLWPWLLLWVPLPFYAISMAYGGVPMFLPIWWPYSYYNVRYGTALLPALIVFTAALVYLAGARVRQRALLAVSAVIFAVLVGASYATVWRSTPICLREARTNNAERLPFDRQVADQLAQLPPGATVLMYTASHAAALEFAGFPLRRTINETNNHLWQAALAAPGRQTDYVFAFESPDDPVWKSVQEHGADLQVVATVESSDHHRAILYQRKPRVTAQYVPSGMTTAIVAQAVAKAGNDTKTDPKADVKADANPKTDGGHPERSEGPAVSRASHKNTASTVRRRHVHRRLRRPR